jgi:E3 ubiquitin-protein ligase RHA2
MGLQGQLSDVSSDSIPLMLLSLLAVFINHLRSFLLRLTSKSNPNLPVDDVSIASGLANIIVLADQLSLNRLFSYRCGDGGGGGSDCVVCLSKLKEGEEVRKLECRHVFHKKCLEGWLHQFNFTCPLCRSALVSDDCVSKTQRSVGRDLISCFSLHWVKDRKMKKIRWYLRDLRWLAGSVWPRACAPSFLGFFLRSLSSVRGEPFVCLVFFFYFSIWNM